jgi:putative FmdB family regulatory protein
MPLYDYKCICGKTFEAMKQMSERACAECPDCGIMANKILSAPAVRSFQYGYFPDIGPNGVTVGNKNELKDACEKHECYAPGVLT